MAQRIELWPIDRLVPYARNARTHSDEQVAQIAASIAEFGFNCPVLVDSNAGIVAGHGRLLAARKLGICPYRKPRSVKSSPKIRSRWRRRERGTVSRGRASRSCWTVHSVVE